MTAPVPQRIGTPYGKPGNWAAGHHTGVDYLAPSGTPVRAVRPATVVYAGWNGWGAAYGRTVILEAEVGGQKLRAIFAHLQEVRVKTGDAVSGERIIGISNNTGRTTGPHLHEEVRRWPYNYGDDVNPDLWNEGAPAPTPTPKPGTVTTFDVSFWNVTSPRWGFGPWGPRVRGITAEIVGEASVHGFAEVYDETQAGDLLAGLESNGEQFDRITGAAGLELFYDTAKWQLARPVHGRGYPSGVQGRCALVVHLTRKATGQRVAFVVTHGPVQSDALKRQFGAWLARLLGQIDGPIVLMGDVNRSAQDKSPRSDIRAAGFRTMRDLAAVTNESAPEFPSKGWNLSDIWVDRNDAINDTIVSGLIDLTSARLSDHRRIEATVQVTHA